MPTLTIRSLATILTFAILAIPAAGTAPTTFTASTGSPFSAGTNPAAIATGDFNGDGKPDIAVANYGGGNVTVLLGNGAGGFTAAVGSPFAAGANPRSVAVADFNSDAIPDLVVTNQVSGAVTVLLGDGTGKFTAVANPSIAGLAPFNVAVGDFNGDGRPDIAVANSGGNNLAILLGNGTGGFTAAAGSPFATGTTPESVAIGDFNGDGKSDVAVGNFGSNNVTVLLGDGTGAFAAATGSPFAAGTNPQSVAVGDFDNDGKADLAVPNQGSNNVTVLLGNGAGGFTAATGSPFAVGSAPFSIAVGDFNGDGNRDLAIANNSSTNIAVLMGDGTGGFATAPGNPFATGANPQSIAVADFDRDGKPDLAVANETGSSVTVLLNTLPAITVNSAPLAFYLQAGNAAPAGIPVSVSSSAIGSTFTAASNKSWLTVSPPSNATGGVVSETVSASQGALAAGTYSGTIRYTAPGFFDAATTATFNIANPSAALIPTAGIPSAAYATAFSVASGDFNGDGKPDIAIANAGLDSVSILLGDGSGGFTAAPDFVFWPGSQSSALAAADFNGDGKIDLAVLNAGIYYQNVSILLGDGTGGFTKALNGPVLAGRQPKSVAVGDFNGDGKPDLVIPNSLDNTVTVVLGDGRGGFTTVAGSPFAAGLGPEYASVGDFNGDGKADIAVADLDGNNVTVLLGNGTGGFTAATGSPFTAGASPQGLAAGDFNGDGKIDFAVADFGASSIAVLLGDGTGAFAAAAGSPFATGTSPASVTIGDFDGDGNADIAVANFWSNSVTVLPGDGAGGFPSARSRTFTAGVNPASVASVDLDSDGRADLVIANSGSSPNTVLLGAAKVGTNSVLSTTGALSITIGTAAPLSVAVSDAFTAFYPPTGTVTFYDGLTSLGTATQTASPYTFNAASLAVGSHSLSAVYGGDARTSGSTSNVLTIVVNKLTQTITFSPVTTTYPLSAGTFAVSGTADSGLTVSFASTTTGVCTISGTNVTIVTAGTCTIQATQAGDATYSAATPVSVNFTVPKLPQTITFTPGTTTYSFSAGTFGVSATADSGLSVSFGSTTTSICTVSGTTVTIVSAGLCTIQASQPGNANYAAATPVSVNFTVTQATQTITFSPAVTSYSFSAATFSVSATASSGLTVSFTSTTIGTCTVSGTTVTITAGGTCTVQATQPGNTNYSAAAPVSVNFTISQAPQTITFAALPARTYGAAPFTLSATATSGLTISYSVTNGPCSVTGNSLTISASGICAITADQAGNATYLAAAPASQNLTVNRATLTVAATSATVAFGAALPALSANFSGFVNGDTAAVLAGSPALSSTATSSPGSYPITVSAGTLAATNYTFSFVNGTMTVLQPPVLFSVSPASVGLDYTQGSLPSSFIYTFQVSSSTAGESFTVTSSAPWLSAPSTGTVGFFGVTLKAAGLAAGNYSATLGFSSNSGSQTVQVFLTVHAPTLLVPKPSSVEMSAVFGSKAIITQDVSLVSTAGILPFTVTSDAAWLSATASGSTTPATLHIHADPTGLPVASYHGSITVTAPGASNSPSVIPVTLTVTGSPAQTSIVSAASLGPAIATPNAILSLFSPVVGCTPAPQLLVNGKAAEILFAGPKQINFVIPNDIAAGPSALIQVVCNGNTVQTVTIPAAVADPAVFTQTQTGTGQASIINQDGTINGPANAAAHKSWISVYGTGFGALSTASPDGLRRLASSVTATIGGITASVQYAGEAPTETLGLQQINIIVPALAPTGPNVPILLTVGGVNTQDGATVAIQ